jgi:hypothetical protein
MLLTTRIKNGVQRIRHAPARARFARRRPDVAEVIRRVRAEKLTYLGADSLQELAEAVIEAKDLPGTIVEAGTALGGSGIVLAAAKEPSRPMRLYDVFGMIPPPSEHDGEDVHARYEAIAAGASKGIDGDLYYGYHEDLLGEVRANFARLGFAAEHHNIEFIEGYYQDTMPGGIAFPVAIAHIDCDWYESVMTCLEALTPSLVVGGRLVFDDYHTWSGCRLAVDEFFARPENADQFEWLRNRTRLQIRRIEDADDSHALESNLDQRDDR